MTLTVKTSKERSRQLLNFEAESEYVQKTKKQKKSNNNGNKLLMISYDAQLLLSPTSSVGFVPAQQ